MAFCKTGAIAVEAFELLARTDLDTASVSRALLNCTCHFYGTLPKLDIKDYSTRSGEAIDTIFEWLNKPL